MKTWPAFSIRKHPAAFCLLLALLTAAAALAGLCIGAVNLPLSAVWSALLGRDTGSTAARIVLLTRVPRVCGGLLAGSALAVSGTLIQTVLNNPLASPHIIGVNAGAGFLTALSTALIPAAAWSAPLVAFLGAFLGVGLVLALSERAGASRMSLILAGVAISNIFTAGIDAIVTLSPDALNGYSDFRIGGLSGLTAARLFPAGVVIAAALLLALAMAGQLDILALGQDTAQSVGLPVQRARLRLLLAAAALAGATVSFAGLLSFVGLLVPQMMRRVLGGDSRPLLAASALGGALLLTLCDLLARTLFNPYEVPVGIVLSFVGGPFFLWLLFRQRGGRIHD